MVLEQWVIAYLSTILLIEQLSLIERGSEVLKLKSYKMPIFKKVFVIC